MALGAAWESDSEGKSWGSGSRESSYQAYMGRGMLEGLLSCHFLQE